MNVKFRVRSAYLLTAVIYGILLYFFYLKYVPLITAFQLVLLPVLLAVLILTAVNVRWGILFFVFAFPLINSLPYFFGIFEHIPHAPSALVLFLFYFLGWLINKFRSGEKIAAPFPVFKPMLLFSLFLFVSLILAFLRYTNFYPWLSDYPYELIVNVDKVTSGGALMSALFSFLNYLSGFLFFLTLVERAQSRKFVRTILVVLLASTFISLAFGGYQMLFNMKIGNLPTRAAEKCINGTLKDPMSFGTYLAAIIPFALGSALALKKWLRFLPLLVFVGGILVLPSTGSLSGLLGVSVTTIILFLLIFFIALRSKDLKNSTYRKLVLAAVFLVVVGGGEMALLVIPKSPISFSKFKARLSDFKKEKDRDLITGARYTYYWPIAVQMIKDYPLSGVGIGSYIIELANYGKLRGTPPWYPDSAENYLLQVGSELGIFALLCSLWLFWLILKQLWRSFRANAGTEGSSYLTAGISAGVLSILVVYFFHTFIGSYEIKYTFWLLVGLSFCLGAGSESDRGNVQTAGVGTGNVSRNTLPKMIGAVVLAVFVVSLLWSSTHSLSLASRTALLGLKQDFGFYQPEATADGRAFRWTREYGGTTIKIEKPVLRLSLLASHPNIGANPVRIRVFIVKEFFRKKIALAEITLGRNIWSTFEYSLPEEVGQEVILLLRVSRTWNPQKVLGAPDPRNLGVAMGRIEFADKIGR